MTNEDIPDPDSLLANQQFAEIVSNVTSLRKELFDRILDPRRDLNKECGFPEGWVDSSFYQKLYDRDFLAARVVECIPREAWQSNPTVYETADDSDVTEFETAWDALGSSLASGGKSFYKSEMGSPIWEYLMRVDIMSGIGRYGVLLFGLDDGLPMFMPAEGVEEKGSVPKIVSEGKVTPSTDGNPRVPNDQFYYDWAQRVGKLSVNAETGEATLINNEARDPETGAWPRYELTVNKAKAQSKLLYLRCFPETLAQITQFEANPASPRFGQPVMYLITFNDPNSQSSGIGLPTSSMNVHWTRVLHVAEHLTTNDTFALPRCQQVLNNVLGARKLYSAAPEGYWKTCFTGLVFETHPQLGGDVRFNKADRAKHRLMTSEYQNGLTKVLTLMGMTAKTLAPQVIDPTPFIKNQLEAIAIKLNIPMRILMGSERGELSSGQDQGDWAQEMTARNARYTTPRIIIRFVDRCIMLGLLPEPKEYFVQWPDMDVMSEAEIATVCATRTTALQQYIAGNVQSIIPPREYLINIMGLNEDTVEAMLEAAQEAQDQQLQQQQDAGLVDETGAPIPQDTGAVDQLGNPVQQAVTPALPDHLKPDVNPPVGNAEEDDEWLQINTELMEELAPTPEPPFTQALVDALMKAMTANFNPNQPRDEAGRFGSTGHGIKANTDIHKEVVTNPVKVYKPDVRKDKNGDGVTDAARIGVPGMSVPPPPGIKPLPNLTPHERGVEKSFIDAFEADPKKMASDFREQVIARAAKKGTPPTFGTDDAKDLHPAWSHQDMTLEQRSANRATLNNPLHQTANAVAKIAFLQHLDTLQHGDEVLITVGGCGAGKGYALGQVPIAKEMASKCKAVWDSAGDQNATENPWIQQELEKRGLKGNYVFVHADPYKNWADPQRGVVKRAGDPADGRMVDAQVFADSYDLGAKNHKAFYERNKDNPNASFVFLENKGTPALLPGVPEDALKVDSKHLAQYAVDELEKSDAPPHVKRGGSIGLRIWS